MKRNTGHYFVVAIFGPLIASRPFGKWFPKTLLIEKLVKNSKKLRAKDGKSMRVV